MIKKLPRRYEGKYAFQTVAIELYKQPKTKKENKTKKEQTKNPPKNIRLVIVSIGLDVVTKIDDEVYVLSIIKICSSFLFVYSVVPKKVELLKIPKVMKLL